MVAAPGSENPAEADAPPSDVLARDVRTEDVLTEDVRTEDVLAEPVADEAPPPVPRAHRTSFHRPRDAVAVATIFVVAVLVTVLVSATSDIRATTSQTAPDQVPALAAPTTLPPSLGETWRAPSSATTIPVAVGSTVVTGDGNEVDGRDPLTGQVRWRYVRNMPLCTVSSSWSEAIAVYRKTDNLLRADDPYAGGGCSEVTSLKANSGERSHQRNGDAEAGTQLLSDGTHVTATGQRLLDTWRSDLVQTMQYGTVPAIVNPDKQPRTDCVYGSVTVSPGRIGVIERCPIDPGDRLTVYRPTNTESDEPSVEFSSVVGGHESRVVAVNGEYAAAIRSDPPALVVFDDQGGQIAEYPVDLSAGDLAGDPPGRVVPVTKDTHAVYWFTGSRTIALSATDFHPLWTVERTLGPGTLFAGYLLLPVPNGIAVVDRNTGARISTVPIDREGYAGWVRMSTIGPIVLEQRGATLVALR